MLDHLHSFFPEYINFGASIFADFIHFSCYQRCLRLGRSRHFRYLRLKMRNELQRLLQLRVELSVLVQFSIKNANIKVELRVARFGFCEEAARCVQLAVGLVKSSLRTALPRGDDSDIAAEETAQNIFRHQKVWQSVHSCAWRCAEQPGAQGFDVDCALVVCEKLGCWGCAESIAVVDSHILAQRRLGNFFGCYFYAEVLQHYFPAVRALLTYSNAL
mmetsp:Transcript_67696/g.99011  ORF Transcript_67696/g.99011 Transcript_67696/m.99011 type:complete len:217 (-) Transcript_67696:402-1052(-)